MNPSRRGFLGRLMAGGFGLAVGQAVTVQVATAEEAELVKAPALMPLGESGENVWLMDGWLQVRQLTRHGYGGMVIDEVYFGTRQKLRLNFEGPGCYDLAMQLRTRFPMAMISLEAPFTAATATGISGVAKCVIGPRVD